MSDSELLKSFVDEYKLNVNGVEFWTPYALNKPKAWEPVKGENRPIPFLGKANPSELGDLANKIVKSHGLKSDEPEDYRKLLFNNLIGVECSGFLYYVLNRLLEAKGVGSINRHLYWSKVELLEAYEKGVPWHRPELRRDQVEEYEDAEPLSKIAEDWGWREPRYLVNMRRIINPMAANSVRLENIRSGDIIHMMGHDGIVHGVVVVSAEGSEVLYAHSAGTHDLPDYYGGVEYGNITIVDEKKGIADQKWHDDFFLETHYFGKDTIARLKVLDHA